MTASSSTVSVLDDDPWAYVPGADEQVMTDCFDGPAFVFDDLDWQPAAPEVEVVEQGVLDLGDAPLLHARDRALDRIADLDAREARLSAERVDALVQVQRLTAAAEVHNPLGAPLKGLPLEMSGSRRLGSHKVQSDVDNAVRLTEVLRLTLAGLRAGSFNVGQAHAVLGALRHVNPIIAAEVERRLFADPRAGRFLPGELRSEVERLLLMVEAELDPQAQRDREANARDGRHVSNFPLPDGMAGMFLTWAAEQGVSFNQTLDRLCRWVKEQDKAAGIERTAAQRRIDVIAGLPGWVEQLIAGCGCRHEQGCGLHGSPVGVRQNAPTGEAVRDATSDTSAKAHTDADVDTVTGFAVDETAHGDAEGAGDLIAEAAGPAARARVSSDAYDGDDSGRDSPDSSDSSEGSDGSGGPDGGPRSGGSGSGASPGGGSAQPGVWPPWAGGISPPAATSGAGVHIHIHIPLATTLGRCDLPASSVPGADPPGGPPPLAPGATLSLHVPLATALGHTDAPAYLERHGWISAAQARALLPHATLHPVFVDQHGRPVHTDSPDRSINASWKPAKPAGSQQAVRAQLLGWARRTASAPPVILTTPEPQYRPSAALDRHLRMRDLRCTGPGCSQPSHRCQLDHLEPHEHGGPTVAWNFGAKSERCHNAKTHGGWSTHRHPDGSTTWTSPLRRRYWTKAFWPAPPAEDPSRPLPDPDDPLLGGRSILRPDERDDDHAPWLRAALEQRAAGERNAEAEQQRHSDRAQRQAERDALHAADPLAWWNPPPNEAGSPPPF